MLKTIDLFAGAGGLSLGFKLAGNYEILAAAEVNKNAQKTYKANIAKNNDSFVFIENVIGYDFSSLNKELGGIDIVIGGPPCQGFSNANRQKNHLISLNNGLVKEYFRAIKEIKPKAFVMENVSMLRSDTHRFYESAFDKNQIDELIAAGFCIPTRDDTILISNMTFEGIVFDDYKANTFKTVLLPPDLKQLLFVLNKDINNPRRLPSFLEKNGHTIVQKIELFEKAEMDTVAPALKAQIEKMRAVKTAIKAENVSAVYNEIKYIVALQKIAETLKEIEDNQLIGSFDIVGDSVVFRVRSYSVIDYINAILGGEYLQSGGTVNAKWFGVPQERKRYIVMGIRRDVCLDATFSVPQKPKSHTSVTVGEAIFDLLNYDALYTPGSETIPYRKEDNPSLYAKRMRKNSSGVSNHITTKTTDTALERFKAIKQGDNFHSLDVEMKSTYSKPERTQNSIYLRLDPDKPSETVVNVRKSMWIHPTLDRAITVREAARLQSFPDSFVFYGTKDSQYQQVGNAVPPLLAKGIAIYLSQKVK